MTDPNAEAIDATLRLLDRLRTTPLNDQEAARLRALLDSRMLFASPNPRRSGFLHEDGSLKIAKWAEAGPVSDTQRLMVDLSPRSTPMVGTKATGDGLVSNGHLGIDVIRVAAGDGFAPHVHQGDHLLVVVAGIGTIAYDGQIYETRAGDVYLVEGAVAHAVGAITDHVILAIGVPHASVESDRRQTLVEYDGIAAEFGTLRCRICNVSATLPVRLADIGCDHCPSRFEPSSVTPRVG